MKPGATDWTDYYENPAFFSRFSRKVTERFLLATFRKFSGAKPFSVLEFGGGNSCFAESIFAALPVSEYAIVDSNELGVELFRRKPAPAGIVLGAEQADLPEKVPFPMRCFDIVYSVGLIEHFQGDALQEIINRHFEKCGEGGLVVMTFPTPTFLYRLIRGAAELLGIWKFPDEYPLKVDAVVEHASKLAACPRLTATGINWGVLLTQGYCVWRVPGNR